MARGVRAGLEPVPAGPNGLGSAQANKAKVEAAQKDVLDLVNGKGDPAALEKKHALEDIMHTMKRKDKGGIGVAGVPATTAPKDGIEAQVQELAKGTKTAAQIKMMDPGWTKMAETIKAIGKISAHHKVDKPKDQPKWDKYNKDMIEQSEELIKAIKAKNPAMIKAAGSKLNQSCNECHSDFRDTTN